MVLEAEIPRISFGPRFESGSDFRERNGYAPTATCSKLISAACDTMDIKPFQLGRLIDLPYPGTVQYYWINGKYRPSQFYLSRVCWLLCLHAQGVNLKLVKTLNWEEDGKIIWKDGVKDANGKPPGFDGHRAVPATESPD